MQSCVICGAAFTRHRGGKSADQKTCGRACGTEYRRQRRVIRVCEACNARFETTGLGKSRFCSPECRPKPDPVVRYCAECGAPFAGLGKVCSSACARQSKLRYDREYNSRRQPDWDRSERSCRHCHGVFTPSHVGQAYCDETCMRRARRSRERASGVRHTGDYHRHRARKFGRRYVPIKPLTIFERDGWVCQICKRRVPKDKKAPHPLSATLDHIIPMSCEGGDHVPENVRLAHLECNWKRGTGGEAVQLALIG